MTQEIILEEREYYDLNNTRIKYTRDIQYDNYNEIFYLRKFYLKEFENNEENILRDFFKEEGEIASNRDLQYRNINVKYYIKGIVIKIHLNIYLKTYNYLETLLYNELSDVIRYFVRDHINIQLSKVVVY